MTCKPEVQTPDQTALQKREINLPEGVPPLASLYLYISGSCNLACRHCWITPDFTEKAEKGKFLDFALLKKAVKEAIPLGLSSVKLTGGEPMLHPDFREIVEFLDGEGLSITMETNGTLVDEDSARFLKSKKKFRFVSVSVDGAGAETHEALRMVRGSFKRAIDGIRNLVVSGFRPQLICTLHRGNFREMKAVIEMAEKMGCGSVKFNHVQIMGRGEAYYKEMGLTINEIIGLNEQLRNEFISEARIPVHFSIPPAFRSVKQFLLSKPGYCLVLNIIGVISTGEYSLCGVGVNVPELVYGNIERDRLEDIWHGSPGLKELRRLIPDKLEGICGNCIHKKKCMGECIAQNFFFTKKLNSPYAFCQKADMTNKFPVTRKLVR